MKLRRLYIGDFGIFRNQLMENISPGMVVIGGPNRSGKSTLMNILRYLGYGFPQSSKLPPPNGNRYEIEADLMSDDQTIYNLKIHGFSEPNIVKVIGSNVNNVSNCSNGNNVSNDNDGSYGNDGSYCSYYSDCSDGSDDSYGIDSSNSYNNSNRSISLDIGSISADTFYGIDQFTYHQLFTINLQQLDKIPRGIAGQDMERLQSILLGAGYAGLIRLPILEKEMMTEADKIGGKQGNPGVKQFKPFYKQIQEGIQLKKKALEQVEIYRSKKEELSLIEKCIEQKKKEIEKLQGLGVQLDSVKVNFELYQAKARLELEMNIHPGRDGADRFPVHLLERVKALQVNYQNLKEQCAQQVVRFKQATGSDIMPEKVKEKLLRLSEHIVRWITEISGIKEQIRQYYELDKECGKKKADLIVRMQGLNKNWEEDDLKKILDLPMDIIEEGKFLESLENYKSLSEERKRMQQAIDEMEDEEKRLVQRLENTQAASHSSLLKVYIYGAAVLILIGGIAAFLDWGFGLLLAIAGIIGVGLTTFIQMSSRNGESIRRQELEAQLQTIRQQIDVAVARYKTTAEDWMVLDANISEYRTLLGLKQDVSSDVLRDYYNAVRNIRERYIEFHNLQKQADGLNKWLRHKLKGLTDLLDELGEMDSEEINQDEGSLISHSEYIFMKLNKWYECLSEALELERKEQEQKAVEQQIDDLIAAWEKYDVVWEMYDGKAKTFEERLDTFIDAGEKIVEYLDMRKELEILNRQLIHSLNMGKIRNVILTDSILVSEESHITSGNFAVILGEGNANSNASDNTNDDVNGNVSYNTNDDANDNVSDNVNNNTNNNANYNVNDNANGDTSEDVNSNANDNESDNVSHNANDNVNHSVRGNANANLNVNKDPKIMVLEKLCQRYGSIDEVEKEWKHNRDKLEEERNALEDLKERYLKLKDELVNLATMENLEKAQKLIDNGRYELRPLAYQYAVYKTAAFLVGKVRKNTVDGVKDVVLGKAAQILKTITSGDYEGILPSENWM
ncbi:MAG: AAA family ATPase, partial [Clostridiaceae bacterium]|nr:AAA family ATPase [Clostridiaceae bacterium]